MSAVAEKEQLIDNVARLRRVERLLPESEDLARVSADLARRIGHTVPRAMAARRLGVSQPALDRWVKQGDIPTVLTAEGRREVPLGALLALAEELEVHEREDQDDPRPLGSVLRARRARAEGLTPDIALPARHRRGMGDGHRRAELRALAYHRAVAARLDSQLVAEARSRLIRWENEGRIHPRYAEEWRRVLSGPLARIKRFISEDSARARDLRQNSPFAGALTEQERQKVLEAVE